MRRLSAVVLAVVAMVVVASAQNYRGVIRGRILDPNAAAIAGAEIKVIEQGTNETRVATSDGRGEYVVSLLRPGSYRIEVQQKGFGRQGRDFVLRVNQELRLDVEMAVGAVTSDPDVIVATGLLRQENASIGTVIENTQITGLPLDGRNYLQLSLLVPGAAPSAQGSAGTARGEFAFSVNGAREDANNFLLDGVYNIDPKLNSIAVRPSVDAIREFEVLANSYDAQFGRNGGAQLNIVMKSGTNGIHGSAYEFLRNRVFDARNFFAPRDQDAPQYQRNQYGFSLGGPVIKDRTFFFGDYEGLRLREGVTQVTNVPTAAERIGDFSQSVFRKPLIPGTANEFPGGRLPAPFLNPIGLRIAALYPLPNRNVPFQNYVSSPVRRDREDLFDVRIDHSISNAAKLAVRYSFTDRDLFEPFAGAAFPQIPGYGNNIARRGQNLMIGETQIFSPRLINDVRFAWSRVSNVVLHQNFGRSVNREVGMPELSANSRDFGLSYITITGYSPLGDEYNNPQESATEVYQLLDTATWTRGRHLVKFGFDIRKTEQDAFRDVQSRGFLTFSSQIPITSNALADLLLGLPYLTGGATLDNPQRLRTESYNVFANDSLRITPRVTLSAGLRYEYNSPAVDRADRTNLYDAASRSLVQAGTNGVPRAGYASDWNNFAPRLGLAWTLGEKTVLRTGYGLYYDQSALAPSEGLYFNKPYFDLNYYFSLPGLPLTLFDPFPKNFPFGLPDSAFGFDRNLRTAYLQHWNVSLQQQLGRNRVAEISYVGSKGTKLLSSRDINQPRPSPLPNNLRPLPQFDEISVQESTANSNYHSLQARVQQQFSSGLSLLGAYTWAKSIDNASGIFASAGDPNYPQDSYNLRGERGRSNFDVAHRFSLSYSYDLPFGNRNRFLAGWQTTGVITLQTGRPFTVALLPEFDNSNTGRANLGFGANDRPNLVGTATLSNPTPERWFDTGAFRIPAYGNFGNSGRNILDGPGYQNVNFSIIKNTSLRESMNLQFRAEFFNLFNHTNFNLPDNFVGSPSFGRVNSADTPRRVQFALKLLF
ncbi:MAG: carboxypeptidase regulatory-like domain-containing protein [Blastocatellia bacterium]|nr:carboxypeptidase regulatory-like domain-containing protein [Blastocatellia bacterium]